jgi:hypothetical protein
MVKGRIMPAPSFILAFPHRNLGRLKATFSSAENPVSYLYLGTDFFARRCLRRELGGNFQEIDYAQLLDEVADDLRVEHVHWIDALNRKYGRNLEWWFGSISSRNVYSSRLFQYSCYLEVLSRLWQSPDERPALVFIESAALGRTIKKWGDRLGVTVRWQKAGRQQLESLRNYLFSLAKWGYLGLTLWLRQFAARRSRKRARPRRLSERPQIMVHTFIHDDSLTGQGDFQDRYLPHLHEFLADHGFLVLVSPMLYGFGLKYASIYARMRQSSTNFIIAEDYLKLADYLFVLFYPLRKLAQHIETPTFRGFDLDDLVMEEQQRNLADNAAMSACLMYRLFKRLRGVGRINLQMVIAWYENQVTDKALIAAVREAFAPARVIGVQLFTHVSNYLNLYPSQSEVEARLTPHLLLQMSELQCRVAQAFTKDIPCRPAAALRYDHLFHASEGDAGPAPASRTVLVLLPFDLAESVEMLEIFKAGLEALDPEVTILVKCHPDFTPGDLLQAFGKDNWPDRFRIFAGSLAAGLSQAAVVVSANSSAIIDAAVSGKPVLLVCRQTALNQRIAFSRQVELIKECYSTDELINAIKNYIVHTDKDLELYKKLGRETRELYFWPTTPLTMQPFLGRKCEG